MLARDDWRLVAVGLLALGMTACNEPYQWDGSLEALLASQPERFAAVLEDPALHRVQILYTQIDRDSDNQPSFRSFGYRLNANDYFYPASTVKLPTAILALEKLSDLGIDGLGRDTLMLAGDAESGKSIGRYVQEILLVSDNQAFNRLYEFLGQEPLNNRLQRSGFSGTRIMHRLETALSVEENRTTPSIRFIDDGATLYEQAAAYSETNFTASQPIRLGMGEIVGGELIAQPKDFASKNVYPLRAQHDVIKALFFPVAVDERMQFGLSEEDYAFVYRNMSGYPGDSGIPEYADARRYPDGYVKFLMFAGDARSIPENIRIFNKVGDAYGFLTDAAYVVDFENGIEFILAATIYTNANGIFNDDDYEYDEIGLPFMRHLGQAIYELELQRKRPRRPDLSYLEFVRDCDRSTQGLGSDEC